jgi:hypothetical protein
MTTQESMVFTRSSEPLDDWWKSQTTRTPHRYQAWRRDGNKRSLCGAANSKEALLTAAFKGGHANVSITVIDTLAPRKKQNPDHASPKLGAVVARHRIVIHKPHEEEDERRWTWVYYGAWKEKKAREPLPVPKRVVAMREQLAIVAAALGKARDTTAAFLASEAGLKEHLLARLLELAARGYVDIPRRGGAATRHPLPKVGVRLVRDYKTASGWEVESVT